MNDKQLIFNNLKFGDLIYAKRLVDTRMITEGHECGPFLVIGKNFNHLICLYGTSNPNKQFVFKIEKDTYNFRKDTYITCDVRLISINEFIKSLCYLNNMDRKNVAKLIYMNGLSDYVSFDNPVFEIGDIIKLHRMHLIIGETDNKYITVRVDYDDVNNKYRYDYENKHLLDKNLKYKRVDFLSDRELISCLKEAKRTYTSPTVNKLGKIGKKINNNDNNLLKIGNLVVYQNFLYYLYYELNDKIFAFEVKKKQYLNSVMIVINGENYYTDFKNKHDFYKHQSNITVVSTATSDENKLIKTRKKDYFRFN